MGAGLGLGANAQNEVEAPSGRKLRLLTEREGTDLENEMREGREGKEESRIQWNTYSPLLQPHLTSPNHLVTLSA